ncbi:MAG TPA: hypothetical protein V6D19_09635 [Stenomitos sp.]
MLKRKFLAVASAIAITALPFAPHAMAQTYTPGPVSDIIQQLNLTPAQQPEVDKIQALAAARIKGLLSEDQLKQLKVLADAGKADSEAFKSLNLTDDQKTQLNEIQLDVGMQLFAVLTPDQQQKLMDAMKALANKK